MQMMKTLLTKFKIQETSMKTLGEIERNNPYKTKLPAYRI